MSQACPDRLKLDVVALRIVLEEAMRKEREQLQATPESKAFAERVRALTAAARAQSVETALDHLLRELGTFHDRFLAAVKNSQGGR